ncbi:hypothetical protein [Pseudomonas bijieensis]|uniref:hypothetical protein n=1 Tax=Pseudomonas bijieensis TaxID=2681983 RepID=UPI001E5B4D00|nr:hypothetical protein [Pseudomonas bijieensis]MCD9115910.1 hypothetical protein [Pseudomonas bijieensis]
MRYFFASICFILIFGCKSTSTYTVDLVSVEDIRSYVSTKNSGVCIFADSAKLEGGEAVAVALATTLVKEGVSMVGRALTEAGANKTTPSAPAFGNFTSGVTEVPVCIQVVSGKFYPKAPPGYEARMPDWAVKSGFTNDQWKRLMQKKIYLSEAPYLFFEGQFAKSANPNIFTLAPIYLSFRQSIDDDGLTFDSNRHLTVAVDFFSPSAYTEKPLGSTLLDLGRVRRGQIICYGKDSQCQYSHTKDELFVKSTKYFWLQLPDGYNSPMYAQSVITETRDGNDFVKFVGKVMSDNSQLVVDTLNNEVEMMISRTKRQETKAALMAKKDTARTAYNDAIVDAIPILQVCIDADESDKEKYFTAVLNASETQRKVNNAAAAADMSPPFVKEFIERPSTAKINKNKCQSSLERIYRGV